MRIGATGGAGATEAVAPIALLDHDDIRRFVRRASASIERHESLLDRLDAALGDGDHGSNMSMGLRSVVRAVDGGDTDGRGPADVGNLLRLVGHTLVSSVGGASGPLYGTAFIEAGFFLSGLDRLDLAALAGGFDVGARALARRGRCTVGDKTILDALDPAVRALRIAADCGDSLGVALGQAALAARAGMSSTVPLVARRGLALRLGERSRGHQDPGATSCFLLVRAMAALDRPGRGTA
jgi:dihydroxyacetone kinase-like protein